MGDGKYIVNMFCIGRVFGEKRHQCCSGGGEANDGDRVVYWHQRRLMGKMWLSGEGEEGDDRWDPHVSE